MTKLVPIRKLIFLFGLEKILEALIDELDDEEDYIQQVRKDLQTTLENYKNRYIKLPNKERTYKAVIARSQQLKENHD